jgi:hypothetical protein
MGQRQVTHADSHVRTPLSGQAGQLVGEYGIYAEEGVDAIRARVRTPPIVRRIKQATRARHAAFEIEGSGGFFAGSFRDKQNLMALSQPAAQFVAVKPAAVVQRPGGLAPDDEDSHLEDPPA